jgi:hypothetical protein
MPSTLFDQTFVGTKKNKRPFGTVSISILLHAIALGVIVALQISTGLAGPPIISHLRAFAVEPDLPKPPPVTATPPPASAAVNVNPNIAPTQAPSTIEPELPGLTVNTSVGVPVDWMKGLASTLSAPPPVAKSAAPEAPARPTGPVPVGGDIRPPERRRQGRTRSHDRRMGRRQERRRAAVAAAARQGRDRSGHQVEVRTDQAEQSADRDCDDGHRDVYVAELKNWGS